MEHVLVLVDSKTEQSSLNSGTLEDLTATR